MKVAFLISVTESGIVIIVKELDSNAIPSSVIIESGIVTDVNPEQSAKAHQPILTTESGIFIDDNLLQPKKVLFLIVVKELLRVTDVKFEQFAYLQPVITQYFVRNKSEICHRPLRVHSKG